MKLINSALLCSYLLALNSLCVLNSFAEDTRPYIKVNTYSEIKEEKIKLGCISEIRSRYAEHDKLLDTLKNIDLGDSPAPKTKTTISGNRILSLIESSGVDPDSILYTIPKTVVIERKGRLILAEEMLENVRKAVFNSNETDLDVKKVNWSPAQIVPIGKTSFDIQLLGKPQAGKVPLRSTVFVDEKPAARFLATAIVDDWKEVPVINKNIERGMLVSPDDIEMVRLNLLDQPTDVVNELSDVIGKRAKNRLSAGDTVRKNQLDIPPLIPKGKKVTMIYKQDGFTATAIGITQEDAFKHSPVKVKNISSKKIVDAKAVSEEEVEVEPL